MVFLADTAKTAAEHEFPRYGCGWEFDENPASKDAKTQAFELGL
jgi:hypothetical protein